MEGKGKLITARGDVYEGNFKNGFKHGQGKIVYRNGASWYEGDWYYNKIEGKGVLLDDFGNKYEGEFKDNMKNGLGKCFYQGNGMRFEGYWSNGIPEKGELFMRNGNHYEGEWRDDRFSGVGTIRFGNGDLYEGEWKEHVPHRYGKMLYRNGKIFNGEWFMGQKHGQGVMSYPNGDQYEGEWVQDMRQGFGIQKYSKGDVYEGEWFNDRIHGKGLLTHADGSSYEGLWDNGSKIEGQGVFQYSNGNVAIRSNYNVNDKQYNIYQNSVNNQQQKYLEYRQPLLAIQQTPQQYFKPKPLPLPIAGMQQMRTPNLTSSQIKDPLINQSINGSHGPSMNDQSPLHVQRSLSQRRNDNDNSNLNQSNISHLNRSVLDMKKQSVKTPDAHTHNPYKDNQTNRSKSVIRSSNIMAQNGKSSLNNSYIGGEKTFKGLSMIPTRPDLE